MRASASPACRRARRPPSDQPRARRRRARSIATRRATPPPPTSESSPRSSGAGVSEFSAPVQSTTEPSEYVCRTLNVYVLRRVGLGRGTGRRRPRSVGTLAARPRDLRDHRVLAGAGLLRRRASSPARARTSRSRSRSGGVSSIFVVVAFSFSVGTASVNTWLSPCERDRRADVARARTRRTRPTSAAVATSTVAILELHLTSRVKGTVMTWPFARVWRNSRHVPATGTRTPTRSFPGVVERAGTLRAAERARAAARAGRADVRVEVVERSGPEEDRVRERAVPRREARGRPARVGDRDVEERRAGSRAARRCRAA